MIDSGKVAITHVGTFSDVGVTETTGGSYARQAITFAAASGGSAGNTASISVPIPAGATIQTLGFFDAASAGNQLGYWPLGSSGQVVIGVGTVDTIASDAIQSAGHGVTTDDRVFFWGANNEALPAGLSATTLYFVRATGLTSDLFSVALTSGGAAVDITGVGECWFAKTVPNTFGSAGNATFAAAALTFDLLRA